MLENQLQPDFAPVNRSIEFNDNEFLDSLPHEIHDYRLNRSKTEFCPDRQTSNDAQSVIYM